MKKEGRRWTTALTLSLIALAIGAAWSRRPGGPEPMLPKPTRRAAASVTAPEIAPLVLPEAPAPLGASAPPRADGFQEAKEASWEGPLSGQVLAPDGPLRGAMVKVEWVAAFRPGPEEILRLKRGGARRDRDGVWWLKALAVTDDAGCFSLDGLPAVQLKITAAGKIQTARPGQNVLLRTGNP